MHKRIALALIAGAVAVSAAVTLLSPGVLPNLQKPKSNPTTEIINRGEYLARAGDCVACHTEPNGPVFAGGRAMPTPFGNLYAPNITPDDETGIGMWTED